ncbi:NAD(P)-binding protein [Corynebacterium sp. 335C]
MRVFSCGRHGPFIGAAEDGVMTTSHRRAAVVGSGPNGLTAAAVLARAGWDVDVHERLGGIGGACATASDVLDDGALVDLGAAGHPFGAASPVFRELGLEDHGLRWRHSAHAMAHPLPGRPSACCRGTSTRRRSASAPTPGPGACCTATRSPTSTSIWRTSSARCAWRPSGRSRPGAPRRSPAPRSGARRRGPWSPAPRCTP